MQVRYWAAARAAAGTDMELVHLDAPASVADVVSLVISRRSRESAAEFTRVLEVCSVLIGDQPSADRATLIRPGATVEFLPPFAGG